MIQSNTTADARYYALLVEPAPGFEPTNWQQTPSHYRVIRHIGPRRFQGGVDAWKFLHNHDALKQRKTSTWAIYHDLGACDSDERLIPIADTGNDQERPRISRIDPNSLRTARFDS